MRSELQQQRLQAWLDQCKRPVIIQIGAGSAIPTLRRFADRMGAPLIRINPNPEEAGVAMARDASLACGALEGIRGIAQALGLR